MAVMKRSIAGLASMCGFDCHGVVNGKKVTVPNGFCGGFSILYAVRCRPSVTAKGYTLSQQGAALLYSTLHSNGLCEDNGAMNIRQIHDGLSLIASGDHELVTESGFDLDTFHKELKVKAGILPIIPLYANGRAFPGNETNLEYHFNCIGAIDNTRPTERAIGGYGCGDDDSVWNVHPARPNAPIWHTWDTIAKAQPIALVVMAGA